MTSLVLCYLLNVWFSLIWNSATISCKFSRNQCYEQFSPNYTFEAVPIIGRMPIHALRVLAECVYEIDKNHVKSILCALKWSCIRPNQEVPVTVYCPLPSSCLYVSESLLQIQEQILSPGSFTFLFPIIRAALTGPRTCSGCEKALLILQQHAILLNVDERFLPKPQRYGLCGFGASDS